MRELKIEEVKKIQLDILKFVDKFCKENNIKYFLTYGTLIGAIRHKGYIPWDDDIDICMPRPDYERFLREFNSKQSEYHFISYELDKNFLYTFGKVIDKNTKLIENTIIQYKMGINIDVFPIDGIDAQNSIATKQILLTNIMNIKNIKCSKKRNIFKNLILILGKIILYPVSFNIIIKNIINNAKKYRYNECKLVCCSVVGTKTDKPVPKDYFGDGKFTLFENDYFYVPDKYDLYLLSIFGDYMKLPPEEQRITHHDFKAYKLKGEALYEIAHIQYLDIS